MLANPQSLADLVTFTEEILNGKLHFLCSDIKIVTGYKLITGYKKLSIIIPIEVSYLSPSEENICDNLVFLR